MLARAIFFTVCLTVFPCRLRTQAFTIEFYRKKAIRSELTILECGFPITEQAVTCSCMRTCMSPSLFIQFHKSCLSIFAKSLLSKSSHLSFALYSCFGPLKSIWEMSSIGSVVPVETPRKFSNAIGLHYGDVTKMLSKTQHEKVPSTFTEVCLNAFVPRRSSRASATMLPLGVKRLWFFSSIGFYKNYWSSFDSYHLWHFTMQPVGSIAGKGLWMEWAHQSHACEMRPASGYNQEDSSSSPEPRFEKDLCSSRLLLLLFIYILKGWPDSSKLMTIVKASPLLKVRDQNNNIRLEMRVKAGEKRRRGGTGGDTQRQKFPQSNAWGQEWPTSQLRTAQRHFNCSLPQCLASSRQHVCWNCQWWRTLALSQLPEQEKLVPTAPGRVLASVGQPILVSTSLFESDCRLARRIARAIDNWSRSSQGIRTTAGIPDRASILQNRAYKSQIHVSNEFAAWVAAVCQTLQNTNIIRDML